MRVLGIDPGTRHLGWGVLDQQGTKITHVAHGVIDTDTTGTLAPRLVEIDDALTEILALHKPEIAVVEALFFAKDAQAASKLGHARGVVLLRMARASLPIFEIAPTRVKRAVVGRGFATKDQVALVMTQLLRLAAPPRSDAADALANAFAHLTMAPFAAAMAAAGVITPKRTRARRPALKR